MQPARNPTSIRGAPPDVQTIAAPHPFRRETVPNREAAPARAGALLPELFLSGSSAATPAASNHPRKQFRRRVCRCDWAALAAEEVAARARPNAPTPCTANQGKKARGLDASPSARTRARLQRSDENCRRIHREGPAPQLPARKFRGPGAQPPLPLHDARRVLPAACVKVYLQPRSPVHVAATNRT